MLPNGDTMTEGSSLSHSQLISEATHFEPNKKPSCIDLVITDQPNFVRYSGNRVSLDSFCHRQITYCKLKYITKTHYENTLRKHITKTHYENTLQKHIRKTHYKNTLRNTLRVPLVLSVGI